jgi:protein translocase SecG subunit
MTIIATILPYIQIILSIILVAAILLQQSGAGVGGALGGGDGGGLYHTRRGFEKFLFITTIVVGILFAVSAFIAILVLYGRGLKKTT